MMGEEETFCFILSWIPERAGWYICAFGQILTVSDQLYMTGETYIVVCGAYIDYKNNEQN